MDTANLGNLFWAMAVVGGPILLGLALLYAVFQRRRRSSAGEDLARRQAVERERRTGTATTGAPPPGTVPPADR